jgi:hypothetical protein
MTFISCGSTLLWSGRSPGMLGRMRQRADLRFNSASAHALAWVLWGTASPKSLRFFLRSLMRGRNLFARAMLRGTPLVEWHPRDRDVSGTQLEEAAGRLAVTK